MKHDALKATLPGKIFLSTEDERVYAAVRISLALAALWNLVMLWPLRVTLLAEEGSVPQAAAAEHSEMCTVLLFHFFPSAGGVTLLMLLAAAAMLLLLAGVLPRLAAFSVFLWQMSLMERAPLGAAGWDMVLRSFSFLVLVSPLGKCWSLLAIIGRRSSVPARVARYGLVLMRLQVLVVYWQTVVLKLANPNPYWWNGEFLPYFLLSEYSRWPGAWVAEYADALALGTWAALLAEAVVPVLLLIRRTRFYGMALGMILHGLITLAAPQIGPFMVVMAATYAAFLTGEDVRRIGQCLTALAARFSARR